MRVSSPGGVVGRRSGSYFANKISRSRENQVSSPAYLLFGSVIYSRALARARAQKEHTDILNENLQRGEEISELFTSSIIFHLKFHGALRKRAEVRLPFNYRRQIQDGCVSTRIYVTPYVRRVRVTFREKTFLKISEISLRAIYKSGCVTLNRLNVRARASIRRNFIPR